MEKSAYISWYNSALRFKFWGLTEAHNLSKIGRNFFRSYASFYYKNIYVAVNLIVSIQTLVNVFQAN